MGSIHKHSVLMTSPLYLRMQPISVVFLQVNFLNLESAHVTSWNDQMHMLSITRSAYNS